MTDSRTLITLIRLLDLGAAASSEYDAAEIEYLVVTRWNADGQGGSEDGELGLLFRKLLRAELGKLDVADVGAALLADIDSRSAGA